MHLFSSRTRVAVFSLLIVAGLATVLVKKHTSFVNHVLPQTMRIKTAYGDMVVSEPVVIEILHSKAMQRLKHINQYGVMAYLNPEQKYTRYQHSVAVFYVLRKFGASLEEQIAGLLHDVSHTVFSHVADYIHDSVTKKYSYQDTIFQWYLENTDLMEILKKYNMTNVCKFGRDGYFTMLKDDLPNLCADRLEYNLYGGYLEGWLTAQELPKILQSVSYRDGKWVFNDTENARIFADVSIRLSLQNWCSSENVFIMTHFAAMLKRALAIDLINVDDLHFSTDDVVWKRLVQSNDTEIKLLMKKIFDYKNGFVETTKDNPYDLYVKTKFRGVDPFVVVDNKIVPLSSLDTAFKSFYDNSNGRCKDHYLAYL